MLDGFTIIERGTNRIVFARQSPTLLATLSNEFKETKRDSVDAKRPQMSSVLAAAYLPKNQTHSIDYVNKNIVWAETIIAYMNRVQHGSVPSLDGEFRVFSYSNDRMIVFTAINALLFIVVGDSDSGELGLRETCKNLIEGMKSVCKRAPHDPETIEKHYHKISVIVDDMLMSEGIGFGYNPEKLSKHVNDLTD